MAEDVLSTYHTYSVLDNNGCFFFTLENSTCTIHAVLCSMRELSMLLWLWSVRCGLVSVHWWYWDKDQTLSLIDPITCFKSLDHPCHALCPASYSMVATWTADKKGRPYIEYGRPFNAVCLLALLVKGVYALGALTCSSGLVGHTYGMVRVVGRDRG